MFLYELAIDLGIRSPDLVARAIELGLTGIGPSSHLSPEQVQLLRASYGKGGPVAPPPLTMGGPAGGPAGSSGGPGGGLSPVAIAAIVVVALLVVGLFTFMLTHKSDNTTAVASDSSVPDGGSTSTTEPCIEGASGVSGIGAVGESTSGDRADLPACGDVAGGLGSDGLVTTTALPADPIDRPRAKRDFCKAARSAMAFEARMVEAARAADSDLTALHNLRDVMLVGRDQWRADVVVMIATGPPRLDISLELYRRTYSDLLNAITPRMSDLELARAFIATQGTDLRHAALEITDALVSSCAIR